jgi:hypothetical protein
MNLFTATGIWVSADGSTYYQLTDHNREPLSISYELVESTQRMANGTLRKYVVAKKFKITASWKDLPSINSELVDAGKGANAAAWIKSFYEGNAFAPIYVRLIYAKEPTAATGSVPVGGHNTSFEIGLDPQGISTNNPAHIEQAFMTSFNYEVTKRMLKYDYVNLSIEFTEI